ncbi:lanthionine synthetase C family protein [Kitasatospora sp. NPDC057500]|uniref:lanthionine synthetase C family protein n=1 Tax=Kitasatospora sp. NPDC057500 TaxID=3346151 RepID=UPI00367E1E9A
MTHRALEMAGVIADRLADPGNLPALWTTRPRWRQSLAHGAPGIALLHIERAAAGLGTWQRAHDWLRFTTSAPITGGPDSYLHYGAPAVAHALTSAARARPGTYTRALAGLDQIVAADATRRVAAAHARIDRGDRSALAEFDAIRGLAGLGAHLLRRDPDSPELRKVLTYLVRLTEPLERDGALLPGWWAASGPSGRADDRFAGGHANNGVAHGIGGPLALLALALMHGVKVDGQLEAIDRVLCWLDRWRAGARWPYWVIRDELDSGRAAVPNAQRPSWCYGSAGLARAQQLAAHAVGDPDRQRDTEAALIKALSDPAALAATTDISLCHGYAGLAHIAHRAAADAMPSTASQLRTVALTLLDAVIAVGADPVQQTTSVLDTAGPAFLEGAAGTALAVITPATGTAPLSGWDACLLIA